MLKGVEIQHMTQVLLPYQKSFPGPNQYLKTNALTSQTFCVLHVLLCVEKDMLDTGIWKQFHSFIIINKQKEGKINDSATVIINTYISLNHKYIAWLLGNI